MARKEVSKLENMVGSLSLIVPGGLTRPASSVLMYITKSEWVASRG